MRRVGRQRMTVGVLLLGSFLGAVDAFLVTVAVPSIRADLPATFGQTQLMVAGYGTMVAAALGVAGRLGDRHGHRRLFLIGMTIFVAASAVSAAAPGPAVLIAARLVQGIGAAALLPQVLSIIRAAVPEDQQQATIGWYGGTVGLGVVCGPALGGLLLAADLLGWGWRWVFLIHVPLGLLVLAGTAVVVRETAGGPRRRMDGMGTALAATGLGILLVALTSGPETGWPAWTVVCLVVGPVLLAWFVAHERRLADVDEIPARRLAVTAPLLPVRLFRDLRFSSGVATLLVLNAAGTGAALLFCLSYYLQMGLATSALRAGLVIGAAGLGYALGSMAAPRLSSRLGPSVPVAGITLLIVGMAGILAADLAIAAAARPLVLLPVLLACGIGQGLTTNPLVSVVMLGVDPRDAGAASGIYLTTGELGNAFGLALFGTAFLALLGDVADATSAAFSQALRGTVMLLGAALVVGLFLARRTARAAAREPHGRSATRSSLR